MKKLNSSIPIFLLIVTSLGYFVDAFDLVIFSAVRNASITDLQLVSENHTLKSLGLALENWQALGLLIGGILWGVLGDKAGRLKVLFGSIALYSIANFLNGFLSPGPHAFAYYSTLRFFSGLGLAGELGASVTLISEAMKPSQRGIGTMILAGFGLLGCAFAAWLGAFSAIPWRYLFIIGGASGFILLFLRMSVFESKMFLEQSHSKVGRGAFFSLFTNWARFKKLMQCIGVGLPVYFVVGLPIKFATNFGSAFHLSNVSVPIAIMMCYIFLSVGDFVCNYLSQVLKSRRMLFFIFNGINLVAISLFIYYPPQTAWQYHYLYCPLLGFSVGYWALVVTNAAEQFGTNLRATVATSVPNFVRSSFIPIALGFTLLEKVLGTLDSAMVIGVTCTLLSLIAAWSMKETFGISLTYEEE